MIVNYSKQEITVYHKRGIIIVAFQYVAITIPWNDLNNYSIYIMIVLVTCCYSTLMASNSPTTYST